MTATATTTGRRAVTRHRVAKAQRLADEPGRVTPLAGPTGNLFAIRGDCGRVHLITLLDAEHLAVIKTGLLPASASCDCEYQPADADDHCAHIGAAAIVRRRAIEADQDPFAGL